jgi:hypothetical protein
MDAEGHGDDEPAVLTQPSLTTGAKLKPYQLERLQWMVPLDLGWSTFLSSDCAFLKKNFSERDGSREDPPDDHMPPRAPHLQAIPRRLPA